MRIFSAILGTFLFLLVFACYGVLPIYFIAKNVTIVLSSLNVSTLLLSYIFGLLWIRSKLSYWKGFAVGTVLGFTQLAASVFAINELIHWNEHNTFTNVYIICGSVIPFIVVNVFVSCFIGGVILGVDPAVDWLCDLFKQKHDLRGKHVLITGGGTGLGQALAVHFASLGANISILSRNMKHLEHTRELINRRREQSCFPESKSIHSLLVHKPLFGKNYCEVECYECDVTNEAQVNEKVKNAVENFGAPDIVVTCAGFSVPKYLMSSSVEEFERLMELNYFGTVKTVRAALPYMVEHGRGSFIFVSSAFALMGSIGYTGYCGSKYAVRGFADALAMEVKPHNISVHQFFPANMDTPSYAEENKTKPIEAKQIDESAATVSPFVAGIDCVNGYLRGDTAIDNAPIEIGTCRILANGMIAHPSPFRECLGYHARFAAGAIVAQSFDDTVASTRKRLQKAQGQF